MKYVDVIIQVNTKVQEYLEQIAKDADVTPSQFASVLLATHMAKLTKNETFTQLELPFMEEPNENLPPQ